MHTLFEQQLKDVATIIDRFNEKRDISMNKRSYLRGIQLCYVILKKTYDDLEDVYFNYILKPQIRLTQPVVISCIMCMQMLSQQKEAPSLLN